MIGSQIESHSGGTRICRACRPDARRWKGSRSAAKDPTGDDTATAAAMSGAASRVQERAIIVAKVWGAGVEGGRRLYCTSYKVVAWLVWDGILGRPFLTADVKSIKMCHWL